MDQHKDLAGFKQLVQITYVKYQELPYNKKALGYTVILCS